MSGGDEKPKRINIDEEVFQNVIDRGGVAMLAGETFTITRCETDIMGNPLMHPMVELKGTIHCDIRTLGKIFAVACDKLKPR